MEDKYEYKFVRVRLEGGTWTGQFAKEYQHEITENAVSGWRFVQCFAPAVKGYGASQFVDLIFEKRVA